MKAKTKKKDPNQAVADHWNVDIRTVRNWRRQGAPLDDGEQMKLWLASRKNIARGVLQKIALTAPKEVVSAGTNNGDVGAAPALKRLEISELGAYERLETAIASNNPIAIRESRESWLRISESLRRYDLQIEQNRRIAGELVPVGEINKFIRSFITFMHVVLVTRAESFVNENLGRDELSMYSAVREMLDQALYIGALGYLRGGANNPDGRIVESAEKCIREAFVHFPAESKADLERTLVELIHFAQGQP
jgi:phage terminase Nu1 subunit (DNA packaging protein)